MKLRCPSAGLLTIALVGAVGAGPAAAVTPVKAPPYRAALAACQTGSAVTERFAVFNATMQRISGAERMEMRFDFTQRRPGDTAFVRLDVPKFGVWERAQPRVPSFLVEKRVNALAAPAAYRVLVRFRWFGADGKVLRRAERRSATCTQPDPRPDLVFGSVLMGDSEGDDRVRYEVVVRNTGRGATTASAGVELYVDGKKLPAQALAPLGAGETDTLTFLGPRCSGATPLKLTLDAAGAIEEAGEANNDLAVPCAATLGRR